MKYSLISTGLLATMLTAATLPMAMADYGHEWMESAPAYCRAQPYSQLTPKQMSKCDEAAFRYLSHNWQTITAANGQAYEIALDTIVRPLSPNSDPRALLRAASVTVYVSEGDTFNQDNVLRFYFDCQDRFQTRSSRWSPTAYAPPQSVAADISRIACNHAVSPRKQATPPAHDDKSYDPIPIAWNRHIGLPGTLSVGAQYCTQSGKCEHVGNDIVGFTIGGTAVGGIQGCQNTPNAKPCLKARIPVEVLAVSSAGSAIVRLKGINYAVGGLEWYRKEPDGSFIGGPVSVIKQGVSIPLMIYLKKTVAR